MTAIDHHDASGLGRPDAPADTSAVRIRPACDADRPGVKALLYEAFSQLYPTPLLDRILSPVGDCEGQLYVGEIGDRLVSCGRLTRLADDEWWAEGTAVHPDFRRLGIAGQMARYRHALWLRIGRGHARSLVPHSNVAVLRFNGDLGYRPVGSFTHMVAEARSGRHGLEPIRDADPSEVFARFGRSTHLRDSNGLHERWWAWQTLTEDTVRAMLRSGEVYAWHGDRGVACLGRYANALGNQIRVWAVVDDSDLTDIAHDVRALAGSMAEAVTVAWRVPDHGGLVERLTSVGYQERQSFDSRYYVLGYPSAPA